MAAQFAPFLVNDYALVDVLQVRKGLVDLPERHLLIAALLDELHKLIGHVCPLLPLAHTHGKLEFLFIAARAETGTGLIECETSLICLEFVTLEVL